MENTEKPNENRISELDSKIEDVRKAVVNLHKAVLDGFKIVDKNFETIDSKIEALSKTSLDGFQGVGSQLSEIKVEIMKIQKVVELYRRVRKPFEDQ